MRFPVLYRFALVYPHNNNRDRVGPEAKTNSVSASIYVSFYVAHTGKIGSNRK